MLDLPESKVKILNVGLLGVAFMLAFTAFNVSNKVTKIIIGNGGGMLTKKPYKSGS